MKSFSNEQKKLSTSARIQVSIKSSSPGASVTAISKAVRPPLFEILMIAASVMYQRLQLLRNASTTEMDVNLETLEISEAYLAVINALSCVNEKNAWIFVSKVVVAEESPAAKRVKREDKGLRY
jgi:hypothetical protein